MSTGDIVMPAEALLVYISVSKCKRNLNQCHLLYTLFRNKISRFQNPSNSTYNIKHKLKARPLVKLVLY